MTTTRKLSCLTPHPDQAELYGDISDVELHALARDIEANGLRNPVEITPDGVIVDGHQRVRAYKVLGRNEIEVIVLKDISVDQAKERFIRANLDRRQLDPLAKARVIKALAELEHEQRGQWFDANRNVEFRDYLAQRLGGNMSGRTVDRHLRLLTLPRTIQDAISRNQLPMTMGLKVAALNRNIQHQIADRIAAGKNPRVVAAEHLPQRSPKGGHDETPADRYGELLGFLDVHVDELDEHADELVGTAMNGTAAERLARAIQFLKRMYELELAASRRPRPALPPNVKMRGDAGHGDRQI